MSRSTVVLIGDPVAHSVSPAMQQSAFDALGIAVTYSMRRVDRAGLASAFAELRRSTLGLNVTAPLKEAVLALVDTVEADAALAGSVNTVRFDDDRAWGASTDGGGFLDALEEAGIERVKRAVVLGSGGGARAVSAALRGRGCEVAVAGRRDPAVIRLVRDLSRPGGQGTPAITPLPFAGDQLTDAIAKADLLVNATPAGSWGQPGDSPVAADTLHPRLTVFDLVSRPRRTRLLRDARARGCQVIEGVEMLVHQGARSFEVWTGRPGPIDIMRAAALAALDQEPAPAAEASGIGGS